MKLWKKQNLKESADQAIDLEDNGIKILRYTDFHWKINGIDVWPSSKKYMKGNVVRYYRNLNEILE